MKISINIFIALLFCVSGYCAYNEKELFTHLETVSFSKRPDFFYYIETNLEKSGSPEIWIAHNKSHNGGNGLYFHVYRKVGDMYVMYDENPILDVRLLTYRGEDMSENDKRIITYFRHSSESGALVSYGVQDGKIVAHEFKEIFPRDKDEELFNKMFAAGNYIVHTVPAQDFRKFLDSKYIPHPRRDAAFVVAADLGAHAGATLFLTNPKNHFSASDWIPFHKEPNGEWKRIKIYPEGKKLFFHDSFTSIRQIDGKKFLIAIRRDAPRKTIMTFYHIKENEMHFFEFKHLEIDEDDVVLDHPDAEDDYAFLEALNFDFDEDKKFFHFQKFPLGTFLDDEGEITIPNVVKLDKLPNIPSVTLPAKNKRTEEFYKLWKASANRE